MTLLRSLLAAAAFAAASAPALAADLPALPSLAADPETQAPNWKGFYVGTEVAAAVFKGGKGAFGGDVFAGYDHRFDNNVVLGVRFSTGYSPWVFPGGATRGFDFAETSVKVGYEMGRLTPYVVTGVALARPTNFGGGPPISAIRSTASSAAPARCRRWGRPASASTMRSPTISMSASKRRSPAAMPGAFGH